MRPGPSVERRGNVHAVRKGGEQKERQQRTVRTGERSGSRDEQNVMDRQKQQAYAYGGSARSDSRGNRVQRTSEKKRNRGCEEAHGNMSAVCKEM